MTNREFENYLTLVSRLLRLKRGQCELIAVELRDHLELRVAELIQSGTDPDEATRRALEEFGDAASLAGQFQFITESYQKRWMMRFATLSVAGLFLAAILTMAMWPSQARFGAPDSLIAKDLGVAKNLGAVATAPDDEISMSDTTRRNIDIRRILTTESTCEFADTPFGDVMNTFSDQYGFNVVLDMSARDDALQTDTPITFKVSGVPLNKALKLMLRERNATYLVSDGVVRIISLDVAADAEYFSRQIFDVSDLLKKIANAYLTLGTTAGPLPVENTLGGAGTAESGGGGALHNETKSAEPMLVELIKTTIAPDSWTNTNGNGTAEILGGLLIVNQTEEYNQQIGELLQDLNYRYSAMFNSQ